MSQHIYISQISQIKTLRSRGALLQISILLAGFWAGLTVVAAAQNVQPIPPPAAGQATASAQQTQTAATTGSKDRQYRIGPGDLLEVRVFNRPQLSLDAARVDARGMIRMPLLETEIQAACHTESELAQIIADQYREYQRNPQAFVLVKEYNSQPVAVIGAVEKPGRILLQRRVRLLELLSFVGGPSEKAGQRIHVAHASDSTSCDPDGSLVAGEKRAEDLDVYTLSDTLTGEAQSNPLVRPGDIVSIPEAEQAFVVGNVYKPSAIPLKTSIRFSEAVAMAGGTLPDSNLEQIRLVRQVPGTPVKQEQFINLKLINQRKAEDLVLLAGDIVEVPTLMGKKLMRSLLTSMGPALVNLPLLILR